MDIGFFQLSGFYCSPTWPTIGSFDSRAISRMDIECRWGYVISLTEVSNVEA